MIGAMRAVVLGAAVIVAGLVAGVFGALRGEASPLGSQSLALLCGRATQTVLDLCVWDQGAERPRVLTRAPDGSEDGSHVWSPDGTRLAFVRKTYRPVVGAGAVRGDLFVIDADGSNLTKLASGMLYPEDFEPRFAWSPDATKIAVRRVPPSRARSQDGARKHTTPRAAPDLYLVDTSSGRTRRLTRSAAAEGQMAWIGSRLLYARVFERPRARRRSQIRVRAGGTDRLLRPLRGFIVNLVASPDGRTLALVDGRLGEPVLSLLNINSGRRTVLVHEADSWGWPGGVDWSPDARHIALSNAGSINVFDARTKRLLREDKPASQCSDPDWSADGTTLVCTVPYGEERPERRGGADLLLVDPWTGAETKLTDSGKAAGGRWRPLARAP